MRILDRLPYFAESTTVLLPNEVVRVKPHQIIAWVSVSIAQVLEWDARTPAFPAILDPGNNFNFSIFESQLIRWAGTRPELLRVLGYIRMQGKRYPRHAADLWLHPNIAGSRDRQPGREPFRLNLDRGIAVYPDTAPRPPHLPLVGLRGLTDNHLQLAIDGKHREVSLHTSNWFAQLLRTLRLPPY